MFHNRKRSGMVRVSEGRAETPEKAEDLLESESRHYLLDRAFVEAAGES
jgi:hypothetical protein